MIDIEYMKIMAEYNKWQNKSLYSAADNLSDKERRLDRGAFFRSIHETLSHLLWGDQIWMQRFAGTPAPIAGSIGDSTAMIGSWEELKSARISFDETILSWAFAATEADTEGDLSWFSGALNREVSKPKAMLIMHMFNHQTHHRGQVHAMITQAGAKPDDTDLFVLERGG